MKTVTDLLGQLSHVTPEFSKAALEVARLELTEANIARLCSATLTAPSAASEALEALAQEAERLGLYARVEPEQQRATASREPLHFSRLKLMSRSPAHYRVGFGEPTPAMRFGTLVHTVLLGGDYAVWEGDRRGNVWKDFEAKHEGRLIVTSKEYQAALQCAEAVRADRVAAPLLEGKHEQAWAATLYGRPCEGRIDIAGPRATVDLKTTSDASPWRFQRQCLALAYHAQLAWYQDARRALGEDPGEAYLIGVETKAPFAVTVLRITPRALDEGRRITRLWVERLEACELANEWPGYVQSAVDLDTSTDDEIVFRDGEEL